MTQFSVAAPSNIPWPVEGHVPQAKRLVQVFTDFGPVRGLDVAETRLQLRRRLPEGINVDFDGLDAFDTLGLGFCMAQYAYGLLDEAHDDEVIALSPEQVIVLGNSAGRIDNPRPRPGGAGEPLVWVLHRSGVELCVVDSGYSLSFLKTGALGAYSCQTLDRMTQFRTRDCWPRIVALIARGNYRAALGEPYPLDHVPDVPSGVVVYTDQFGNVKTTIRLAQIEQFFRERERDGHVVLRAELNGRKHNVTMSDGNFNVPVGTLAFAPGSSHLGERSNPCMELFRRGHARPRMDSAADLFSSPRAKDKLLLVDLDGKEVQLTE